ncbi:MAG: hypothetical protein K1X89_07335 [Myxococcaceae bacterium]|nr:hypothetical protein [Myxococcaceae bacterium]
MAATRTGVVVLFATAALVGCKPTPPAEKPKPIAAAPRPAPAPMLKPAAADGGDVEAVDAVFTPAPFSPAGPSAPETGLVVELQGEQVLIKGEHYSVAKDAARYGALWPKDAPVLLVPDEETYLAQIQPILAALDDAHAQVWLKHPLGPLAYPVVLRDEPKFQAWIEEPVPGKLRVIQRADGFELQTNLGKLAGVDPNGPSVPVRGGQLDLATLQRGLDRVKSRFHDAPDVCFVPSFGTTLEHVARAVASNWLASEKVVFASACLVYPRPKSKP